MCVARGAFRDYSTMEELLKIAPPPGMQMNHLYWDLWVLGNPFMTAWHLLLRSLDFLLAC
jgi:hypothetical protein